VTQRKDSGPRKDEKAGTWWFVTDLGPGPDGKRRQAKRRGFRTKAEAQEALDRLKVSALDGVYVAPKRQTLREFVVDDWLPAVRHTLDRDTWKSYERNLRLHVLPVLGGVQVQAVDPAMLNRLFADLLADGGRRDGKAGGLKPRTVRYIATIIHAALKDAMRWGRVIANAADRADPPSAKSARAPEMKVWTRQELRAFLTMIEGDRYRPSFLFLATTGCRRGEALGLRWTDLDLDATPAYASIRQQLTESGMKPRTKTDAPRVIELDRATVASLRAWRAQQAEERLRRGAEYQDSGLVFSHADGHPYDPKKYSREFDRRLERDPFVSALPRIRLHDLRHTWATLALLAGVDVKIVSERLGHSSPMVTWQTYQHVIKGMQSDAAEQVAALIFGAGS
jgi:integrase